MADTLVLDYLKIEGCLCNGRTYGHLFDTEIGDEYANLLDPTERREASTSTTDFLRRRYLQLEPSQSAPRLSVPRLPLSLW